MKDILKRFSALMCLVAMLSLVSLPAFGGENPWDSDGDYPGSQTVSPNPTNGTNQPVYLGTVYIGADGLLTFVSQSVNYLFNHFSYQGRNVTDRPDSRTETSQQEVF